MRNIPRIPPQHLVIAGLAVLVLSVYWQVGNHAFINFDDDKYVTDNPTVLRGLTLDGVSWALTTLHFSNWHPLTWLSHMADVSLFGLHAGWHHRVNVLLHLLNTELLFLVMWRMTGGMWPSAFVAALFGVHPLHVESVAWVAERKDVLSTLFWILTMGAYLRYVRRPGVGRYLLVGVSFALGLMSKPMLVTLPFVLLLLDWWPLGRLAPGGSPGSAIRWSSVSRLALEKVPLLVLAAMSCVITYLAQTRGEAIKTLQFFPFTGRVFNALASYGGYLAKTVWPSSLAVFYPHPSSIHAGIPAREIAGAILLLGGLSVLVLREGHRRPYLAVGWLWFLGTLVPVIGLVQVGAHAMADRYTYVPLIGVFIAFAWGIPEILAGGRYRRLVPGALGGAVVLALSVVAWSQVGYWRDSVTLFTRALAVTDGNWLAFNNLGASYHRAGQPLQAIAHCREAVRIKPDYADAWNNLGAAYGSLGQNQEAIVNLREALRVRPDHAGAWNNLGAAYLRLGQPRQAVVHLREAVRIKPDNAEAWNNLGAVYGSLGQTPEAIACLWKAVRIKPDYAEAWNNLGLTYDKLEQFRQAAACYREALRIKPDYAEGWNNLGAAYGKLGQPQEAVAHLRKAVQIKPDYAEAWNNLGVAHEDLGQLRQAVACYQEAVRVKPDYAEAWNNLGAANAKPGPSR